MANVFAAKIGGCEYRRENQKVTVNYQGREYRGDIGTAEPNGVYLRVRCYAPGPGNHFCEVDYDTRGQRDSLGIYHDRPEDSVLTGVPDAIEFFTRGPRFV